MLATDGRLRVAGVGFAASMGDFGEAKEGELQIAGNDRAGVDRMPKKTSHRTELRKDRRSQGLDAGKLRAASPCGWTTRVWQLDGAHQREAEKEEQEFEGFGRERDWQPPTRELWRQFYQLASPVHREASRCVLIRVGLLMQANKHGREACPFFSDDVSGDIVHRALVHGA